MRWPWQPRPNPLGDGVWRRAHDTFRRAVDRYHQVVEPVPECESRTELDRVGAELAAAVEAVFALCLEAQRHAPSAGLDVPGGDWTSVHRSLTRAGGCVAQAAEGAALARVAVAAGDAEGASASCSAARRAADQAVRLVGSAGPTPPSPADVT